MTMATTPLPKRISTSVPRNSAISSGIIEVWILSLGRGECFPEPVPCGGKILGKNAGFADSGHEVGIAMPAWQDVHVDVAGDSGARAFADVHPEVEPAWLVNRLKMPFGKAHQRHHFGGRGFVNGRQLRGVRVRNDHKMTAGVGIAVQHNEIVTAAMDDHVFLIAILGGDSAEHTTFERFGRGEISVAPWTPEIIHFNRPPESVNRTSGFLGNRVIDARIYDVLQFLARFEIGDFLGGDFHARAGFGIPSDPRLALPGAKTAEAPNLNFVVDAQGSHDAVEDRLNDNLGFFPGHFHYA